MYELFTDRSRKVLQAAKRIAQDRGDGWLGVHHLFMGLVESGNNVALSVIRNFGVDPHVLCAETATIEPRGNEENVTDPIATPRMKQLMEYAIDEAKKLGHNYVGTEHLLLGLLRTEHSLVDKILGKAGVDYQTALEKIRNMLGGCEQKTPPKQEISSNFYRGVLERIVQICKINPSEETERIEKIAKQALLDGGKWQV